MRILAAFVTLWALPLAAQDKQEPDQETNPRVLYQRGEEHFFAGRVAQALEAWDKELELRPERRPYHWQRGLSLYYAERYEDGVAQFESHQTVNARDVENAVWHFLCAVRAKGGTLEKAREKIYPFAGDSRIPMKEIHSLFKGTGKVEDVLAAANADKSDPQRLRNHLCYAHLYLGLYYEALGEKEKSAEHIKRAAVDFKMDHYMGKVAQVHHQLRNAKK